MAKKWLNEKDEEKLINIYEKEGCSKTIKALQKILARKGFYDKFFKQL